MLQNLLHNLLHMPPQLDYLCRQMSFIRAKMMNERPQHLICHVFCNLNQVRVLFNKMIITEACIMQLVHCLDRDHYHINTVSQLWRQFIKYYWRQHHLPHIFFLQFNALRLRISCKSSMKLNVRHFDLLVVTSSRVKTVSQAQVQLL